MENNAVIYTRVSTTHQDATLQLNDCHRCIVSRRLNFGGTYPDVGSGTEKNRPHLGELLRDARRGHFKYVVVWSLDRLARNVAHLLDVIQQLHDAGVQLISVKEAIDASSPFGKAMVAMFGIFAEVERELLRERIRAGQQVARERGKKLGRPRALSEYDGVLVVELKKQGHSCQEIASAVNKFRRKPVHRTTIHRFLKAHGS